MAVSKERRNIAGWPVDSQASTDGAALNFDFDLLDVDMWPDGVPSNATLNVVWNVCHTNTDNSTYSTSFQASSTFSVESDTLVRNSGVTPDVFGEAPGGGTVGIASIAAGVNVGNARLTVTMHATVGLGDVSVSVAITLAQITD